MLRPIWVALACGAAGCLRAASPQVGPDRSADTGVPVAFGEAEGPSVDWDFGDGARASGPRVEHVFGKPGRYRVRALAGSEELGASNLEVVQRPVVHAIPATADGALYLPRIQGRLEQVVDFAEKLAGPDVIQRFLESSVLPSVALEEPAVEAEGGIGVFTLSGFRGLVGVVAAKDGPALLAAVERRFQGMGAGLSQNADQTLRVHGPSGSELALLADRGYVYLVVPQPEGEGTASADPQAAIRAIRQSPNAGLEGTGSIQAEELAPGSAYLFLEIVSTQQGRVRSVLASFSLAELSVELDGLLLAEGPLWRIESSPPPSLLAPMQGRPIAAASVSASPKDAAGVALSLLKDPRRADRLASWGLRPSDLDPIADALSGDAAVLAYFDAVLFYAHLAERDAKPEPRGSVYGNAGLLHPEFLDALLKARLTTAGVRFERTDDKEGPRYQVWVPGTPSATVRLLARSLVLTAGDGREGPLNRDLASELQQRWGTDAFGKGHISAMVDVAELLGELEAPIGAGPPPPRVTLLQNVSAGFVRQLTPIDSAFIDVVPTAKGAHVRGKLTLRRR